MLTTRKLKDVRGRKITGYQADLFGAFERTGPTLADAKADCLKAVERAMDVHARYGRRYIFTQDGTVLAFYYNDGWCYDQARASQSPSNYCGSSGCGETREDAAFAAMLHHAVRAYGGVVNMTDDQVRAAFRHGRDAGWTGYCHEAGCLCERTTQVAA